MRVLELVLVLFLLLELANVGALYFVPGSDKFNALGVFKAWEKSKQDSDVHDLVRYLAYWVAGTKLIFIALLTSVLIMGSDKMKVAALAALILAITSFFWRLFPLSRRLDSRSQLNPKGYSKALAAMIAGFLIMLLVGLGFGLNAI